MEEMPNVTPTAVFAFMMAGLLPLYARAEMIESLRSEFQRATATMEAFAAMKGLSDADKQSIRDLCALFAKERWPE